MKIRIFNLAIVLLFSGVLFLTSCDKEIDEFLNEQFPEPNHTSSDIMIDGEIAAPLLNTGFTLGNFIPTGLDSSLWVEVDQNDLIHLRMYFKDIITLSAADIFVTPITVGIPADSISQSTDTSKLKMYENALTGHLFFNNPTFKFVVRNKIPVVTFFKIDTLRMHSPAYDTIYARENQKYYINAPQQTGLTSTTTITIDKTVFPDFENFFSPIPKYVSFFVTAGSDTYQTLPAGFPIVYGNETLSADIDIDLPMDAHLVDLVMSKNFNFGVDSLPNYDQIDSVKIKIIFDNEFPFGGITQVSFADTNDNGEIDDIIMNLFGNDGWNFEPSITDPNGFTTSSSVSSITVLITKAQLDNLKLYHASKIIVTTNLNSYQSHTGQDVKILGSYKLSIKAGIKISYKVNTGNI